MSAQAEIYETTPAFRKSRVPTMMLKKALPMPVSRNRKLRLTQGIKKDDEMIIRPKMLYTA